MEELFLRIELLDDVALSETSASVGGGATLTRIPGAALLGAAASQGYPQDPELAFTLFHSSCVRFGDAFPDSDGARALPLPLCLHWEKGVAGPSKAAPRAISSLNLALRGYPPNQQLVQLREGYVDHEGTRVSPRTRYSMRTAVGKGGKAREGFLFGLETLQAGQSFRVRVQADDPASMARIREILVDKVLRLGRSRSAEFGRARLEEVGGDDPWKVVPGLASRVVIWCLSDLALRDADTGAPRLLPTGADFAMPEATLVRRKSFLRFRRYSPFNGFRRRPELERQVVSAGSVLVFEGPEQNLDELRARAARRVGEWTRDGLGEVMIQPVLLESDPVELTEPEDGPSEIDEQQPPAPPDDDLGRWIAQRLSEDAATRGARELSRTWSERRELANVNASQWGEVRRIARRARASRAPAAEMAQSMIAALKEHVGKGVSAKRWSGTPGKALLSLLEAGNKEQVVPATELLAARMVRLREEAGDE